MAILKQPISENDFMTLMPMIHRRIKNEAYILLPYAPHIAGRMAHNVVSNPFSS